MWMVHRPVVSLGLLLCAGISRRSVANELNYPP